MLTQAHLVTLLPSLMKLPCQKSLVEENQFLGQFRMFLLRHSYICSGQVRFLRVGRRAGLPGAYPTKIYKYWFTNIGLQIFVIANIFNIDLYNFVTFN
jgi:hypothetical protein